MVTLLSRLTVTCLLLTLLAGNVLTLTNAAFNAALSGALASALGVRTVTATLSAQLRSREAALAKSRAVTLQRQAAARRFGRSLVARSRRVAARSVAAIPLESVPYIGAAAIVAGTAYELYAMCATLGDLELLYRELGIPEAEPADALQQLCASAAAAAGEP